MILHPLSVLRESAWLFLLILGRYVLLAGVGAWWMGRRRRLSEGEGGSGDAHVRGDILLSVQSAVVFALAAEVLLVAARLGVTRLYDDPQRFGWWYLAASFAAVLLLQDTIFYFSHRLFHHRLLYRWFHASHHHSVQPTPWTSFAFDIPEAVFQAGFLLTLVMVLPLHWGIFIALVVTMSMWSVINHLGLERPPVPSPRERSGPWLIGPSHHAVHHRDSSAHFGLYFTWWDRWLGTQNPCHPQPDPQGQGNDPSPPG